MTFICLLPGTFCVRVAVETTDEHEHLGLEPMNFALHQTQENRKKEGKGERKGRDGSPNGSSATFSDVTSMS